MFFFQVIPQPVDFKGVI